MKTVILPGSFKAGLNSPSIENTNSYITDIYTSAGLYDKVTIINAKYRNYSRFGRLLDAHGRLNNTTEYLFFTKMDLHITEPENTTFMKINPELADNDYFVDLIAKYPDVVRELQKSAAGNTDRVFSHLISFCVSNSLDLPGMESTSIDGPSTVFGTSIEYPGNAEASDENHSFSLEFIDSKELELFHFFKAYQEYQIARKSGTVSPIRSYTYQRRLHNTMGCYKFLVAEDMETIIYWAYLWNVWPVSCPREAFSDPLFPDGLTFSVNFKSTFIDDMKPNILRNFNDLMEPMCSGKNPIPILDLQSNTAGTSTGVIRTLPTAAQVKVTTAERGHDGRAKYKLLWY